MPIIDTTSIRPIDRQRPTEGTDRVRRRDDGSGAFRPQTNVNLKAAIKDIAATLGKISAEEKSGLQKLPKEIGEVVKNILQQSLSVEATLGKGIGSTVESQRFSMEQLMLFSRMLIQIGSLAERGYSMKLSEETQALLSNFKNAIVAEEGGEAFEPVLMTKAAFELVDAKTAEQLPQALYEILSQLAQMPAAIQQQPQQSESMQFLNQLIRFFMPRPGVDIPAEGEEAEGASNQQGQQQSATQKFLSSMFKNPTSQGRSIFTQQQTPQGQFNQQPTAQGQFNQQPTAQGQFNQPTTQGQFNQPTAQGQFNQQPTPQGQFNQPTAQGQFNQQPTPQGQFNQQPVAQGQFNQQPTPQGQFTQQPTPQGQFNQQPTAQGQFNQPTAQGQFNQQPTPQGQFNQQPVAQGQFTQQPTPQGQFNQQPTPQGQFNQQPTAQGQFNQQPTAQGQFNQQPTAQGQFNQQPTPQGQFNQQPTAQGQFNQPTSQGQFNQPTSQGQFNQQPTPQGQFNQQPTAQGQFNQQPTAQGQFNQPTSQGQFNQQSTPQGQFNQPTSQGQFNQQPTAQGQFNQQPTTQGQFNQPPAQGQLNQPNAQGQFNQPNAQGQFNQPNAQGQFNQPTAQGQFNQPTAQGQLNQPNAQGQFNQPTAQGQFNQPTAQGQFNQPTAQGQFNQPSAQGQFNQPSAQGQFNQQSQPVPAELIQDADGQMKLSEEFIARQKEMRGQMKEIKAELIQNNWQNTPETNNTMKSIAQFLLRSAQQMTPRDFALLQNFVNQSQETMSELEARHLQNLLRLCQNNLPMTVQQAAVQQKLPDLPRLWAFMQMCDLARISSGMNAKAFKRAGRDVADFAMSMRRAMTSDNTIIQNQRSFQMMMPIYLGDNTASYPTYLSVYDENERDEETGEERKETWLRICVLTDHIGAAELVFRIYNQTELDLRFYFSRRDIAEEFRGIYLEDLKDSINNSSALTVGEVRVGGGSERMFSY